MLKYLRALDEIPIDFDILKVGNFCFCQNHNQSGSLDNLIYDCTNV